MKNSIKIKDGKEYYFIRDKKIKYLYINNRHRHIDIEDVLKTIDSNEKIYGIQEIRSLKIDENIEKEYFERLLKITSKWEKLYHNNKILDGKQWSIKISYNGNELSYWGNNEYPENWDEFENFLEYIINNKCNVLKEKSAISMPNEEVIELQNLNEENLKYNLLELCIYYILSIYPKEQQTLFNCACLLNDELHEIYANKKDLLFIQSDEFIINYLSKMFFKLKNENKERYNQLIEEVIEAVTYYCVKNSDQLLQMSLEFIESDGVIEVINLAHTVIDYKENTNLNKYVQMLIDKINNINYYQAMDIIQECLNYCKFKSIEDIRKVQEADNGSKIVKLIGDINTSYYLEIDSNNILQSIKENSIDGYTIYKGGLDSLFD